MKHPALIQLRGNISGIERFIEKFEGISVMRNKHGLDVYFEDVNSARRFISRLKRLRKFKVKSSTKYAGLRKGRVRWLFTYSVRIENEG